VADFQASPVLSHPHNRLERLLLVQFGIDFGNDRRTVAKDDPGRFQTKLLTQERGGVVAKLVRMPTVSITSDENKRE
jgi:hypothetical protein